MKKSDKKIDNALRVALTEVCEQALERFEGFRWLTHEADCQRFPASLRIVCVFDTGQQLAAFLRAQQAQPFQQLIVDALSAIDVSLKRPAQHIHFDSEEACLRDHRGRWQERIAQLQ